MTAHAKIQNGKWTDLNLMDQNDPEDIKEQSKQLGRILDANYKKADSEQEVSKLTHLNKFQRVILLGCLKCYEDLFDGNIVEWTVPPVDITLKDKDKPLHTRALPITVTHIQAFKKYFDILVTIGALPKVNCSEWAAPRSIIQNKYDWFIFISDFR